MIKRLVLIFLIILLRHCIHAQADCIINIQYKISIKSDSTTIVKVAFPKTRLLAGYIEKTNDLAFAEFASGNSGKTYTISSHMGSIFCGSFESMIHNVFHKPEGGYIIRLYEPLLAEKNKYKMHELTVPMAQIVFQSGIIDNKKCVTIDLGEIRID